MKTVNGYEFIEYAPPVYEQDEMLQRSRYFLSWMDKRRTVREFSDRPVSKDVIDSIIMTASTAPSGAHKQPWMFCVVSNAELKRQIREAAEKEERENYANRMSDDWIDDLKPLQTDANKEFLETAPYLIVVFKKVYDIDEADNKRNNYYVTESVGIACGFLLAAIHHAGLVALTHTPSPMNFLSRILKRPENERPFLLIPVGYPAEETWVPNLRRKGFAEICKHY